MTFTAGSLASGIGGLDLAASFAGFDIRWQVEINPFCRKVLARHAHLYWPHAEQYEDVYKVGRHNLEVVDCVFGGFACQDVSLAGKRAGITPHTRSGLWFEFARIIGELRPRVVLLENVKGIWSLGGARVVGDLAEMGYDALWLPLFAADAGSPQLRERWFCLAYTDSYRQPGSEAGPVSPFGCNGMDDLNCSDFRAIGQNANAHLAVCGDEDRLDSDGDGRACER